MALHVHILPSTKDRAIEIVSATANDRGPLSAKQICMWQACVCLCRRVRSGVQSLAAIGGLRPTEGLSRLQVAGRGVLRVC
ncbi:hypothetical protein RB4641 [Rhodopirellula baltica SH 1]|uniref:Uncharacterized protein n=1 Tax=Rhodopirellula baltica (strain DSM 10527 / NCIMB 13988 / SH1) TaxID=243090 RepID=Q7US93_RHOBA|nr:hypothetical protein RB4641 [Rhodopirellula baltica SH 1]